jgi:glycosyltransferase involved in cell wall biosynthesis
MGVRGDRISCLPPFVFSPPPDAGPPGGGSGSSAPYVLYAGNLHPYQDLDLLLRSFRIVAAAERKTHLLIVTHNEPSRWEKRMGRLGIEGRVTFLTGLPFEQEWERMSDAAVLALPRLRCPGYPMKLLNYLAAARPIVASEDSARGLTHGRDAYVVTEPGPEAFARGLLSVLRSRPLALRLAEGAGRTAKESLSPRNLLVSLERIYERVSPPSEIWVSTMAATAV